MRMLTLLFRKHMFADSVEDLGTGEDVHELRLIHSQISQVPAMMFNE